MSPDTINPTAVKILVPKYPELVALACEALRNVQPPPDDGPDYSKVTRDAQYAKEQLEAKHRHINPVEDSRALAKEFAAKESQNGGHRSSPLDGDNNKLYQGDYGENRESQTRQNEYRKPNRKFSTRTKSGCMTCRKRKKKCDEARPLCNNCTRGGFVCRGFLSRGPLQMAGLKTAPVLLQPKYGYDVAQNYSPNPSHQQQPCVDTQHARIYGIDNDRLPTMPPHIESHDGVSYSQASRLQSQSSAYPYLNTYTNVQSPGLIQKLPRTDRNLPAPSSLGQLLSHTHFQPISQRYPEFSTPITFTSQNAARAALSHLAPVPAYQVLPIALPPKAHLPGTKTELTLLEQFYFPSSKELVAEHERCFKACSIFNNDLNAEEGRASRFRAILQPIGRLEIPNDEGTLVTLSGAVGSNVVVESPFWCDYGYNIRIGESVAIGRNCTIVDCAEVRIGDKTILGPNVSIYTTILPISLRQRKNCERPQRKAKILIGNDCWIGGGVTISHSPGSGRPIIIGEGSSILPGSVVTTDVPKFSVFSGNPAVNQGSIDDK